jgi:hypothetical protein
MILKRNVSKKIRINDNGIDTEKREKQDSRSVEAAVTDLAQSRFFR